MKYLQKFTALALAALLLILMAPGVMAVENDNGVAFTEVKETVYATTSVNVRTGPSTSFKRIGMLNYGDSIQRIGVGENGWSKVLYEGDVAYMYSDYLSLIRPAAIDYSRLSQQIAIAGGLREANYTAESWAALTEALDWAREAMKSNNQKTVDECEKTLKEALDQLADADRTQLQDALKDAESFASGDEKRSIWLDLAEAIAKGKALQGSNDQPAIDEAASSISQLLGKAKAMWEELTTPKVVTQEVQVEVPPTDDYCNMPMHRVWPVLFFCSLAVNVALGATILVYVHKKKKNQRDDTPLVDYDISDDIY